MTYVEVGRKELKTKWPHEKGLTAKTQKQTGRIMNLVPVGKFGVKSTIPKRKNVGL